MRICTEPSFWKNNKPQKNNVRAGAVRCFLLPCRRAYRRNVSVLFTLRLDPDIEAARSGRVKFAEEHPLPSP